MRRKNEARRIAIFFTIATIISLALAFWIPYRIPRISFPLRLTSGYTLGREFVAPRSGNYRVSIYCSAGGDLAHIPDALKGGNLVQIAVSEGGVQLKLHYFSEFISDADWGNIASGPAPDELGQDVADFAAERGKTYHITCSVIRPSAELDQTKPRLYIALDPLDAKGDSVLSGLLLLAAAGCAVLAGIAFIVSLLTKNKRTYPIALESEN